MSKKVLQALADMPALQPSNAYLITPNGKRVAVNVTPEAAAVWTRYGFTVEFVQSPVDAREGWAA